MRPIANEQVDLVTSGRVKIFFDHGRKAMHPSIKTTSFSLKRGECGQDVIKGGATGHVQVDPISRAITCASVVFPKPEAREQDVIERLLPPKRCLHKHAEVVHEALLPYVFVERAGEVRRRELRLRRSIR